MAGLLLALALGATVASAEVARGPTPPRAAANLSCFQCFKVGSRGRCAPAACRAEDRVCVSHELYLATETRVRAQISKRCAVRCPNSNSRFEWQPAPGVQGTLIRQCCAKHLCNPAPAVQEGLWALPRGLLLGVGLGLLCSVL